MSLAIGDRAIDFDLPGVDGQKYTSHWVTSPMKHGREACRTCHTQSDQWLLDREPPLP